jgi:hypothetical protein
MAKKRLGLDRMSSDEYGENIYGIWRNLTVDRLPSSKSTPNSIIQSYAKRTTSKMKTADKVNRPGLNKGAGYGLIGLQDKKLTSVTNDRRGTFDVDPRGGDITGRSGWIDSQRGVNAELAYNYGKKTIKTNARVKTKGTRKGGK